MAIVSGACIQGSPVKCVLLQAAVQMSSCSLRRNVPTVFVYHDGAVVKQLLGLAPFGGPRISDDGAVTALLGQHALTSDPSSCAPTFLLHTAVEWVLAQHGAVKTELEDDPREAHARAGGGGRGRTYGDDDEDD